MATRKRKTAAEKKAEAKQAAATEAVKAKAEPPPEVKEAAPKPRKRTRRKPPPPPPEPTEPAAKTPVYVRNVTDRPFVVGVSYLSPGQVRRERYKNVAAVAAARPGSLQWRLQTGDEWRDIG